jgi:hypothetical protein
LSFIVSACSAFDFLLTAHVLLLRLWYSAYLLMFVQLYPAQVALVNGGANQVRSYAKEAAPADRTPVNGDGMSLPFLLFVVKLASCVFKKLPSLYIFQQCGMNLRNSC